MIYFFIIVLLSISALNANAAQPTPLLDSIIFGNSESEKAHNFSGTHSTAITGGLGETARKLNPSSPNTWRGETMSFELKVDKSAQTYFTVRLWGSDTNENILVLFIEGKQVGYLHLGDIDILDHGSNEEVIGKFNDRFQYATGPLPVSVTKDKTSVHLEIRAFGRIYPYATTADEYYRVMTVQSRGIYSAYTHVDGFFEPPTHEKQGNAPSFPIRKDSNSAIMDKVKTRVTTEVNGLLQKTTPMGQMFIQFLAKAYYVKWTAAYNNSKVVDLVISWIDHIYTLYVADPKFVQMASDTWNPEWFGVGACGEAVWLLSDQIKSHLTQQIDNGKGTKVLRSTAWTDMLKASRDYHLKNRRQYTNQGMITDMYVYLANKGIQNINSSAALAEQKMLELLYQAVGINPWLGSENDAGAFTSPYGTSYYQITAKGLTRELGYAGYYGEILDWVTFIYEATRPKPGQTGDEKIRKQLEKAIQARGAFRYQELDLDGYKAMIIETIVGWRDYHYPGGVVYAERLSWDGTPILAPARTLDSVSLGYVQQMIKDNQFYSSIEERMKETAFRVTAALLTLPDDYDIIKSQATSSATFPMSASEYVFSDVDNGVVAIKHNNTIFYASLYWRARYAINNLARVHYITPTIDRIATVYEKTQYKDSGKTYERADWVNFGFSNGGVKYTGDTTHSANAGEKLPVPALAVEKGVKIGDESIYAGRADFYQLQYGPFLIGLNWHPTDSHDMAIPSGVTSATDLVSKTKVSLSTTFTVKPFSTQIFYIG